MARFCGVCKGSGWVGARTDFGHRPGGPCRVCGGSGYDQRWGEKMCKGCSNMIEYRYDWSNSPDYCESCKRDQYKACANPHCNGTVRYKIFWDRIPDYCSCKGFYQTDCENPHCHGTIRVHSTWTNVPKYCSCKGWYEAVCNADGCSNTIRIRCDWSNPPTICESCKKNRFSRAEYVEKTRPDGTGHRTWYDPATNSRMSWDVEKDGTYKPGTGHDKPDQDKNHINEWDKK